MPRAKGPVGLTASTDSTRLPSEQATSMSLDHPATSLADLVAYDDPLKPTLLTLDEIAVALGMSKKSVQRRIKAGLIRRAPIGGRLVRISSDELRRLSQSDLFLDHLKDADPD